MTSDISRLFPLLALDQSPKRTGWSLWHMTGPRAFTAMYGSLSFIEGRHPTTAVVMLRFDIWLHQFMKRHQPLGSLAWEAPIVFPGKQHFETLRKAFTMSSLCMMAAERWRLAGAYEINPAAVKKWLTGNGRADKDAMREGLTDWCRRRQMMIAAPFDDDNEVDSICIGLRVIEDILGADDYQLAAIAKAETVRLASA